MKKIYTDYKKVNKLFKERFPMDFYLIISAVLLAISGPIIGVTNKEVNKYNQTKIIKTYTQEMLEFEEKAYQEYDYHLASTIQAKAQAKNDTQRIFGEENTHKKTFYSEPQIHLTVLVFLITLLYPFIIRKQCVLEVQSIDANKDRKAFDAFLESNNK